MKLLAATLASLDLIAPTGAQTDQPNVAGRRLTPDDVRMVAPALEPYTEERLHGEVWKRPGLAPRDRSIVTIAALIARNVTSPRPYHFNLALDHGVEPREISEIITHLTFYSGWVNAMAAGGQGRLRQARDRA